VAKKGAICPIFEGDMTPKRYTPEIGANTGALNWNPVSGARKTGTFQRGIFPSKTDPKEFY
jgi:hypothetical protein